MKKNKKLSMNQYWGTVKVVKCIVFSKFFLELCYITSIYGRVWDSRLEIICINLANFYWVPTVLKILISFLWKRKISVATLMDSQIYLGIPLIWIYLRKNLSALVARTFSLCYSWFKTHLQCLGISSILNKIIA